MASNSEIDVRDLRSVRKAAHDRADVVLGEDWVAPDMAQDNEARAGKPRRGVVRLNRSPLARKIIIFNLLAIVILVVGVLYLNPSRDNLIYQRANGLVNEAELIADVIEAQLPASGGIDGDPANIAGLLDGLDLRGWVEVFVVDASGAVVAERVAPAEAPAVEGLAQEKGGTILTDFLNGLWEGVAGLLSFGSSDSPATVPVDEIRLMAQDKWNRTLVDILGLHAMNILTRHRILVIIFWRNTAQIEECKTKWWC